jgi:hypothetical protein
MSVKNKIVFAADKTGITYKSFEQQIKEKI